MVNTQIRYFCNRLVDDGRVKLQMSHSIDKIADVGYREVTEIFGNIRIENKTILLKPLIIPGTPQCVYPLTPDIHVLYQIFIKLTHHNINDNDF